MKVKVLGCYGGNIPGHGMTSFLVNGTLALDAGWVSGALAVREQERVRDVLISHSHLDHTFSILFLYGAKPKHLRRIRRQLPTIGDSRLEPLEQGRTLRL
jgi:glyoxylase-like metal-dependent hydrolase (beta-lactamase superfamily II)